MIWYLFFSSNIWTLNSMLISSHISFKQFTAFFYEILTGNLQFKWKHNKNSRKKAYIDFIFLVFCIVYVCLLNYSIKFLFVCKTKGLKVGKQMFDKTKNYPQQLLCPIFNKKWGVTGNSWMNVKQSVSVLTKEESQCVFVFFIFCINCEPNSVWAEKQI